ncbi:hypothetical protein NGUA15_00029 [Salmonella enterica]|nr:hypothetical protein NGUA15_00029 [Salmonella enterica]
MNRDDLSAHQTHTEDVRRLALNVFGAHIDTAFQTQQGAGERRGDAVLTGAGFSDNLAFPHPFGQQRLTQYLIGFVCAAVQ